MNYFFSLTFFLSIFIGSAQPDLNDYKYIIVPKKFSAFKKENQHQTSTLLKFLFAEEGFNVVYDDNLPEDLKFNRCLGLTADIMDKPSMFSTKTTVLLKNCNNVDVFTTKEGTSKKKEYKLAYNEALREAMLTLKGIAYKYNDEPQKGEKPIAVSFKNDVKQLKPEKKKPVFNKYQDHMVRQKTPLTQQVLKKKETIGANLQDPEILTKNKAKNKAQTNKEAKDDLMVLYAQSITNGYQLVDSAPKIRFKIFESTIPQIFHGIFMDTGTSGILYKKEDNWVFEHHKNGKLFVQDLRIKF